MLDTITSVTYLKDCFLNFDGNTIIIILSNYVIDNLDDLEYILLLIKLVCFFEGRREWSS